MPDQIASRRVAAIQSPPARKISIAMVRAATALQKGKLSSARPNAPAPEAGCPPVETALMVFLKNEPPRTFKILARINEVTFDHVYNLIENPLPCC